MDNTEKQNVKLFRKLESELAEYKQELLSMSAEEILTHAYEYTIREDIVYDLEYNDLSAEQASALLKLDKPLEAIYQKFEHMDCSYMSMIHQAIEVKADDLIMTRKRDQPEIGR